MNHEHQPALRRPWSRPYLAANLALKLCIALLLILLFIAIVFLCEKPWKTSLPYFTVQLNQYKPFQKLIISNTSRIFSQNMSIPVVI
jgi:hypothetical protein